MAVHRADAGTGVLRQDPMDPTGRYLGRLTVVGFTYDVEGYLEGARIALKLSYEAPRPVFNQDNSG